MLFRTNFLTKIKLLFLCVFLGVCPYPHSPPPSSYGLAKTVVENRKQAGTVLHARSQPFKNHEMCPLSLGKMAFSLKLGIDIKDT